MYFITLQRSIITVFNTLQCMKMVRLNKQAGKQVKMNKLTVKRASLGKKSIETESF